MSYTCTTFSNRFYHLDEASKEAIDKTIASFCRAVYSSYNLHFEKEYHPVEFKTKYGEKSLHMIIKERANCDTYYANSITQLAKGKLESQKELLKQYTLDKEAKLKSIDQKIKEEKDKLAAYQKTLHNLYEYRDALKSDPKVKLKVSRFKNISSNGYIISVRKLSKNAIQTDTYGLFAFEYDYLLPKIRCTKNKISQLIYRRNNVKNQIDNLMKPKHIVFGGKHKLKDLTYNKLMFKKYNEFSISGRKDAKYGNFVFKATPVKDDTFNVYFTLMDGTKMSFSDVRFPYCGRELAKVLKKDVANGEMTPICFGIVRRKDHLNRIYYQFKVSFDIGSINYINTDTSTGCFGMDFNYGHLDITEIDEKGNMVFSQSIPYQTDGSSYENEISLRKALNEVGKIVSSKHKVLVIEKLDTSTSKRKSTYRDPKTNRIFHTFPYAKYLAFVEYIGMKYSFDVIKVSPVCTSIIGAIKYQDQMKLNGHIAASFVIARRGMNFSHNEKIPKQYKNLFVGDAAKYHYWKKFIQINKKLSK